MSSRKIGILGGTFDPVHNGHINLARLAYDQLGLDAVLFVPNNIPPHKEYDNYENNDVHRLNMLKLALCDKPEFQISEIELLRKGPSYSYKTLELLSRVFKKDSLYFLMGDDSFFSFHTWVHPELICRYAELAVAKRDEVREDFMLRQKITLEENYNARITFLDGNIITVSSSEFRNSCGSGEYDYILPGPVLEYIKENKLYGY